MQRARPISRLAGLLVLIAALVIGPWATAEDHDLDETFERSEGLPCSWGSSIERLFGLKNFACSYALVVGVGDYEHWNNLEAPLADARRVRDYLIEEAGFDYVVVLTNAKATRERIEELMLEFFPDRLGDKDRFLFYFSGHGTQRETGRGNVKGYLPLQDSREKGYAKMISMDDLQDWSDLLGHARQALFVLDSCFSGLAGVQRKSPLRKKTLERLSQYGHHLITAGTENEVSIASLNDWGGSLFTDAFLRGAAGAADTGTDEHPKDGIVSLKELSIHVGKRIDAASTRYEFKMSPQIADLQGGNAGEFFFVTKQKMQQLTEAPDPEGDDLETKGAQLANLPALPLPRTFCPMVQTFSDCPQCPEMVEIPSGSYQRGSSLREHEAFSLGEEFVVREMPQQEVTIDYAFAVGQSEITRGQFERFVAATGYEASGCMAWDRAQGKWREDKALSWQEPGFPQTDDHPVACINWEDAKAYTRWLAKDTGKPYRLLSASEWEYVARAGTETARYWGDSRRGEECYYANGADVVTVEPLGLPNSPGRIFMCEDQYVFTAPAGEFRSNAFCLNDIIGNVYEWTEDCFVEDYEDVPRDGSAWTGGGCSRRVLRGGSWFDSPTVLRSAFRGKQEAQARLPINGFRVARDLRAEQ